MQDDLQTLVFLDSHTWDQQHMEIGYAANITSAHLENGIKLDLNLRPSS